MRLLARIIVNGLAIIIVAWLLPGLHVSGPLAALLAGAILGVVNAFIRPVLILLTLPITLVTLGFFILVVNAICLALTAWVVPGFSVNGVFWTLVGAFLVSIVSWILNGVFVGSSARQEPRWE